jgi:hypothetical protein
MHDPFYYREQAHRARRLASEVTNAQDAARLNRAAQEFDEMAEDLESGAKEFRHPDLLGGTRLRPRDSGAETEYAYPGRPDTKS